VAKIRNQQALALKQTEAEVAEIEDKMHLAREKAKVDAVFYASAKSAESEKMRLTPQYLELARIQVCLCVRAAASCRLLHMCLSH
jgi:hypothetical protein